MHHGGIVDKEMHSGKRKCSDKFRMLVDLIIEFGKGVSLTTWGKGWAEFVAICEQLRDNLDNDYAMRRSQNFSETKQADHAHDVMEISRNNYKAVIIPLYQLKAEG